MNVYLLATLDTKGEEAAYLRDRLQALGVGVVVVDTGSLNPAAFPADIARDELFALAGTSAAAVRAAGDRGAAVGRAAEGAVKLVRARHAAGDVAGVLSLGGSGGTIIGTAAMRALPLGVPKLMVSTLAAGQVRQYVGEKDIFMLNAVVDVSGLNRISRRILTAAARAMAGLVTLRGPRDEVTAERPVVALSMFGVTTPCVEHARKVLEAAGYEALVFHATGTGGRTMESLIRDGVISAVLDLTTTELADELVGGVLSAGPERLTAAAAAGIPQVISAGATDMVNFLAPETVPERFRGRRFHAHDPHVTLMRTTVDECARIGAELGRKAAAARGPVAILLPRAGVSALDAAGRPFDDPAAREALFASVRAHAGTVEVTVLEHHINDPAFAEAAAQKLLALLHQGETK